MVGCHSLTASSPFAAVCRLSLALESSSPCRPTLATAAAPPLHGVPRVARAPPRRCAPTNSPWSLCPQGWSACTAESLGSGTAPLRDGAGRCTPRSGRGGSGCVCYAWACSPSSLGDGVLHG